MTSSSHLFTTSEFGCAVALLAAGFNLEHVDKNKQNRCQFSFINSAEAQKIIQQFWSRQLQLRVSDIFSAQRYLKSIIYNAEFK